MKYWIINQIYKDWKERNKKKWENLKNKDQSMKLRLKIQNHRLKC